MIGARSIPKGSRRLNVDCAAALWLIEGDILSRVVQRIEVHVPLCAQLATERVSPRWRLVAAAAGYKVTATATVLRRLIAVCCY